MTKINKEGWEIKKLGEICNLYQPQTITSSKHVSGGPYPVFGANGIIGYYDKYNHEFPELLIGCRGTCGTINVSLPKSWINGNAMIAHIVDDSITFDFLVWQMRAFDFKLVTTGASQPQITRKSIECVKVLVPPINTQHKAVEELNEINAIISAKEQQLAKLDELTLSVFYDMFGDPVANNKGWKMQELGNISTLKNGLNFDKTSSGIKLRFLGVSEFQSNRTLSSKALPFIYINEEPKEEFFLHDGDIVFVRSNGSKDMIGRSVLVSVDEYEKISFSGFCIRCRITSSTLNLKYIQYVVQHPSIRHLITHAGRGCNISNLNQKILSALLIPLPPLALQETFATRISAIEEQKAVISASIEKMKTLLNARMQEYFG